jgi:DNA-binding SARP family transcriptional activator
MADPVLLHDATVEAAPGRGRLVGGPATAARPQPAPDPRAHEPHPVVRHEAAAGTSSARRPGTVRFSVLGLVTITDDVQSVVFRPSKPVSLLAALLLYPNQPRSVDFLQNAVWEDCPSPTSKATLQTYVLRLRKLFQKFGISDNVIETVPGGYRLPADAASLDLVEFRDLVRAAGSAATPADELPLLRQALALWQGPPLANIHSGVLHRDEVPRLTEEWLRAAERCFDVQLALAQHRDATAAMRAATQAHPGHERFREQLIEALYRSGRQADALAEYRDVKSYLREELGVYPGPGLQRLEAAILRGEEFAAPEPPRPPVRIVPAGPAVPAPGLDELPPDLPHFVGREREVRLLAEQLTAKSAGPMVVVVSGPPGVGKTALAVRLAHLLAPRFPGGQWIARPGSGPADGRAGYGTALGEPSRTAAGGSAGSHRPAGPGSLLLIDGAADVAQIEPLLPTEAASAAIVTARTSLAGLVLTRGSRTLRLDALPAADSLRLLASMLGPGWAAAEAERDGPELADLCGHFPYALRVAAARLLAGTEPSTGDLVRAIRADPARRLALAGDRATSVHGMLAEFLAGLDRPLTEAFVRLGAATAQDLSPSDCAALLGRPAPEADHLLDALVDMGLVGVNAEGRYRVNTLLRGFCAAVVGRPRPGLPVSRSG